MSDVLSALAVALAPYDAYARVVVFAVRAAVGVSLSVGGNRVDVGNGRPSPCRHAGRDLSPFGRAALPSVGTSVSNAAGASVLPLLVRPK